jgi:hypothetical protein
MTNKINLRRGLRRVWVVAAVLWIAYWIWVYGVNCHDWHNFAYGHFFNDVHDYAYGRSLQCNASPLGFDYQDMFKWIFGVPVLGAAALWIVRVFRPLGLNEPPDR